MNLSKYKFTKTHEWILFSGDSALVGISDYAQNSLGDVTYIELPKPGKRIKQGETLATVESVKAASDIFAPVSGVVAEGNQALATTPELLNSSPYEDGWICRLETQDVNVEDLMDAEGYATFCEGLSS